MTLSTYPISNGLPAFNLGPSFLEYAIQREMKMSMNKAEKAEMAALRDALALSRAMKFPDYAVPNAMSTAEIMEARGGWSGVVRGWFYVASLGGIGGYSNTVTYGCSNGISHNRTGDKTTTQGGGRMYRTKLDALQALRHDLTKEAAKELAHVDAMLMEAATE